MFKAALFFSLSILLILSHSLTIYPSLSYPHAQWKYYSWPGACDCASWCARRPPNSTRAASSRWRFTMSSCSPASSMCPCELPHTLYCCTVYICISLCTQVVSAVTRQSGSAVHHILLPHAADSDAAAGAHLRQQGACSAPRLGISNFIYIFDILSLSLQVYIVLRSGKSHQENIGLGAKASGAKFNFRPQVRTFAHPSSVTTSTVPAAGTTSAGN